MPDSRRIGGCTEQIGAGRTEVARNKLLPMYISQLEPSGESKKITGEARCSGEGESNDPNFLCTLKHHLQHISVTDP